LLALSLQPALAVHGRECARAPPPPSGVCAASPALSPSTRMPGPDIAVRCSTSLRRVLCSVLTRTDCLGADEDGPVVDRPRVPACGCGRFRADAAPYTRRTRYTRSAAPYPRIGIAYSLCFALAYSLCSAFSLCSGDRTQVQRSQGLVRNGHKAVFYVGCSGGLRSKAVFQ